MSWLREYLTLNGIQSALLVRGVQVLDLLADDEGKLNLIVKIDALGLDHRPFPRLQDGAGRLEEEKGLLRPRVVQFGDVVPGGGVSKPVEWWSPTDIEDHAKKTVYTRIVAANANDLACLPEGCHGCTHRCDCSEDVSCNRAIYVASVMRCRIL
jgi:hypothetical protein